MRARSPRRLVKAALIAAVIHGALVLWLVSRDGNDTAKDSSAHAPPPPPVVSTPPAATSLALVTLSDELGPLPQPISGSHDELGSGAMHPLPRAAVDLPGQEAAASGGTRRDTTLAPGTPNDSWSGRRDRELQHVQTWDNDQSDRLPRAQNAAVVSSPESLPRTPELRDGDRTSNGRPAHAGELVATAGGVQSEQPGGGEAVAQKTWDRADPLFDSALGRRQERLEKGALSPRETALTDIGERANEAAARDQQRDTQDVAAASTEKNPALFEMSSGTAGRGSDGAQVRRRTGVVAQGAGRGTGATRADLSTGNADVAVRARRTDPYFRRMYARLDKEIKYPRELALALESGELVVRFRLRADGHASEVTVVKSSGYAAFDEEIVRAIEKTEPYGPVPESVLEGRSAIVVDAPYAFRNPLIR